MADEKKEVKPFFTTERVKLYAPKGAKWHKEGEETLVQAKQKRHFLKKGYTETAPVAKEPKESKEPKADGPKTMTKE